MDAAAGSERRSLADATAPCVRASPTAGARPSLSPFESSHAVPLPAFYAGSCLCVQLARWLRSNAAAGRSLAAADPHQHAGDGAGALALACQPARAGGAQPTHRTAAADAGRDRGLARAAGAGRAAVGRARGRTAQDPGRHRACWRCAVRAGFCRTCQCLQRCRQGARHAGTGTSGTCPAEGAGSGQHFRCTRSAGSAAGLRQRAERCTGGQRSPGPAGCCCAGELAPALCRACAHCRPLGGPERCAGRLLERHVSVTDDGGRYLAGVAHRQRAGTRDWPGLRRSAGHCQPGGLSSPTLRRPGATPG